MTGSDTSTGGMEREVLEYIKPFAFGEHDEARIVKVEKHDIETGQVETHVGIEVKLDDGRWFYKTGFGRCLDTDTERMEDE